MAYPDPAFDDDDVRQNIELARLQGQCTGPSKILWWRERAHYARRRKIYRRVLDKLSYHPLISSDAGIERIDAADLAGWVASCAVTKRQCLLIHYLSEGFAIRAIAHLLRVAPSTVCADIGAIRIRCAASC